MNAVLLLSGRNLVANRARFVASVGGVALAFTLMLALDAIFAGVAGQLTTYVRRSGADIWVAQEGVRNLHMVASALPDESGDLVRMVPGVAGVTPILEATDTITAGDERAVVYVVGLPTGSTVGGPWDIAAGSAKPGPGAVIVDVAFAGRAGVGLGDPVMVLGREMRIAGLSRGTASLVNSVAFVTFNDFRRARADAPIVSYLLVETGPGATAEAVASRIERDVEGVTAQTNDAFADEERRLVMDMSADVIAIMSAVGFAVSLVVVALTVYVATIGRRREYGVLKALGAPNRFLYAVVVVQAFLSAGVGFFAGLAVTGLLAAAIPFTGTDLALALSLESLVRTALFATVIGSIAAALPVHGMAGVDPADVFRRGALP